MKEEFLDVLACPSCKDASLTITGNDHQASFNTVEQLCCSRCGRTFPVINGVPRLVEQAELCRSPSKSFGYQWMKWLKGAFEKEQIYGSDLDKEINEFFRYTGLDTDQLKGKRVLDAGCGSGRLTQTLGSLGATVVGMDVHSALDEVQRACDQNGHVAFVQGSILKPPLKERSFDLVWSEGVIHHTGDTPGAFDRLAGLVKPGGRLFVWVYWTEEQPIYRRVRNLFRFMHVLPMPLLFGFCYSLAVLLYLGAWIRGLPRALTGSRKLTPVRLHAFRLFDHLSPKYNTQHSEAEVRGWFARNGFCNVVRTANLGVRGDRPSLDAV